MLYLFLGMFLGTSFCTILNTFHIIHKLEKGGLNHEQICNYLFK